ncbi:MAG: family 78 glycoside hydrolase catalytic domain [Eubacteriales bacterium]|nr:family 78 glycoside hydrolase catalytic domain [Eubacteriales bacterium]
MGMTELYDFQVEYQDMPLGLDCERPRFSWKMKTDRKNAAQSAYRLTVRKVGLQSTYLVWDSGRIESARSNEIFYEGEALEACTRYAAQVSVWDELGQESRAQTWFETGLMNPSIGAWEGAQFIGPSRYSMCAALRGIFAIETRLRFAPGSGRGGIVFGAQDERLLDSRMNEYGIEGEHCIRYELDMRSLPAQLLIYRIGYAKGDNAREPFARVTAADWESGEPVITQENRYEEHTLRVEVTGDCAYAYLDGHLIDAVEKEFDGHKVREPRQLNPRRFNDCITYPRLNEIGFCAGEGDTVYFERLTVQNLRTPCAVVVEERPSGGLYGEESIFAGKLPAENGWFCLRGGVSAADADCAGGAAVTACPRSVSIPMLRTVFSVRKGAKLRAARLYATARGIYDCRINGEAITQEWFAPGCSQFDKHLMYQTYDVTGLLREGENGIGVTLASGWWSDAQTYVLRNYNYYGDRESFLGRLVLTYEDGSRDVIVTGPESWRYFGKGPYTYAGFFHGERLDGGRLDVYERYSLPEYDESGWEAAQAICPDPIRGFDDVPIACFANWPDVNGQEPELVGSYQAPVREYCRVCAKSMTEPRKGLYLYDLEQEMAGVPELTFHEKAGTVVTIRYGEMLYPALEEYGGMCGMMLLENYRDASSTDIYICRGDEGGETYCPKFTFHGYRYIEISGISRPLPPEEVVSIQLSSIPELTGAFESSHALLNRFVENVRWSQLCNFISIPTDCPQRNERMGWAGDTHVFCGTANRNSDLRLFYYRSLEAFCDLQRENGQFPEVAPAGGGFGGITYESAPIYMTWELYRLYGDGEIVRKMYPALERYMEYLRAQSMPGLTFVGPLGDWLAPEETDMNLLWNAFYGRDCLLMGKMAAVLGDREKEERYAALHEEAVSYWNRTFVDPQTGRTVTADGAPVDTQCSYALPLCYGLIPEENRALMGEHLARKVRESGCRITTGFFGTGLINEALTETGHADLAFSLMLQTAYPSWLYPVTQGATTIWERWNSYTVENGFGGNNDMNSFNHYSLGSVVSWLYRTVLGIREDEEKPGYAHFFLTPHAQSLDWAKGGIETTYGRIESAWERAEDGKKVYRFRIPANTRATVTLPGREPEEYGAGEYCIEM